MKCFGVSIILLYFVAALDNKNVGTALRLSLHTSPEENTEQDASSVIADTDVKFTQSNFIVLDNAVLYGVPYFILNPLKTT